MTRPTDIDLENYGVRTSGVAAFSPGWVWPFELVENRGPVIIVIEQGDSSKGFNNPVQRELHPEHPRSISDEITHVHVGPSTKRIDTLPCAGFSREATFLVYMSGLAPPVSSAHGLIVVIMDWWGGKASVPDATKESDGPSRAGGIAVGADALRQSLAGLHQR